MCQEIPITEKVLWAKTAASYQSKKATELTHLEMAKLHFFRRRKGNDYERISNDYPTGEIRGYEGNYR